MITIGLIFELLFISKVGKTPVKVILSSNLSKSPVTINIDNETLEITYLSQLIWRETLKESTSMFGIESVQEIAQIIKAIDMGDNSWLNRRYIEHEKIFIR